MIKQAAPCTEDLATRPAKREDARDLHARLYREIGISAVAAALCVATGKDRDGDAAPGNCAPAAPDKSDIAA